MNTIEADQLVRVLGSSYAMAASLTGGKNADYIPFLASVPSGLFGLAIVTVDGQIYEHGDARHEFAIESISKVLTLAAAIESLRSTAAGVSIMAPNGRRRPPRSRIMASSRASETNGKRRRMSV